jgi:UDP-N-acetylmuramoyl-L-alanyl-D-glutamate--2,6-diaminopimelate ligase
MKEMALDKLLESARLESEAGRGLSVSGVTDASNKATAGCLFVAVKGTSVDARRFIPDAVRRGAAAVLVDDADGVEADGARLILAPNARQALARLAHAWHDHPARDVRVAGVTGTNGKTTVTYYLESIFKAADMKPGVIGTLGTRIEGASIATANTTPSALEVAAALDAIRRSGGTAAAMEVSSHGVDQSRVEGMAFAAAIMTNLSQDHLDYHGDMASYGAVKSRFFFERAAGEEPAVAIFNVDDSFSSGMASQYKGRKLTYGIQHPANINGRPLRMDEKGSAIEISLAGRPYHLRLEMPGAFNIMNALAAVTAGVGMGIDTGAIVRGIEALHGVPGRFEKVDAGQPFGVIVDFAHTPAALNSLLNEARRLCKGRLTAVFGCGGDRDKSKRPLMGEVAASVCDHVVVTNCNPRTEDPPSIARMIVEGVERAGKRPARDYDVELERRDAIRMAFDRSGKGDMVVIAGRGHEPRQLFAGTSREFDDRVVAREILAERGYTKE